MLTLFHQVMETRAEVIRPDLQFPEVSKYQNIQDKWAKKRKKAVDVGKELVSRSRAGER